MVVFIGECDIHPPLPIETVTFDYLQDRFELLTEKSGSDWVELELGKVVNLITGEATRCRCKDGVNGNWVTTHLFCVRPESIYPFCTSSGDDFLRCQIKRRDLHKYYKNEQ